DAALQPSWLGLPPRAGARVACCGAGADRLRARAPARGVFLGEPAVSAGHGRIVRLGAARRSACSAADRGRRRGVDRHLPRAARLQLSVNAWPRWYPGVSSIVLRRPPRLDALMRARLENWPIPESRKAQRSPPSNIRRP